QLRSAFAPYSATNLPGRVSRVDRGAVDVITEYDELRVRVQHGVECTVGDWIALDDRQLTAVLPRRTALVRSNVNGTSQPQVLASNIGPVFVAVPITKAGRLGLVERFVAISWESGATPVVLLTKADLVDDPDTIRAEVAANSPGADVHAVSAR